MKKKYGGSLPSIFPEGLVKYQEENERTELGKPFASCSRCGARLSKINAETCWFCSRSLCVICWEEHGECGHEGAIMTNKYSRDEISAEQLMEYRNSTTLEAQLEIVKRTDPEST